MDPSNLCDLFFQGIALPKADRFLFKSGSWRPISSDEFGRRVRRCAGALSAAGIGPGDRVAILSYNRPEWAVADYAALTLGAVTVPIYSTLPADQVGVILQDSGARFAFVENGEQARKVAGLCRAGAAGAAQAGLRAVSMESAPSVESFDEFAASGERFPEDEHRRRAAAVSPADLATLIYTSGTTGVPKGVMLTHANIVSNMLAACALLRIARDDVALSFLPLSHIFERLVDYALFHRGATIAYAESVDKVSENLLEARPTIMAAVPRFYEKVYARIQEAIAAMPPRRRRIFDWARAVGALEASFRMRGLPVPFGLRWRFWWARRLVFRKLHARVGGRVRIFLSGSAPLSREIAEFFFSVGFTVIEGYGLTETSPVLTLNREGAVRLGTVGQAIPGVELRIAPDGEILARGPNIMKGYYGKAAETAEVLRDGWLQTGDIGQLDAEGYLKITDRKKDLLKTSGGKYVAPQPIENRLRTSPLVAHAVVLGDARKFPSALIVPDYDALRRRLGSAAPNAELARDGKARALFGELIGEVNRGLAHHEALKKFALLDAEFTVEAGELTPTLKVKRRVIEARFKSVIDGLYAE